MPDAHLEIDCLIGMTKGDPKDALQYMQDAIVHEMMNDPDPDPDPPSSGLLPSTAPRSQKYMHPNNPSAEASGSKEHTPQKPALPAIIDGKFVSPRKTSLSWRPTSKNEDLSTTTTPNKSNGASATTTTSRKHLHPYTHQREESDGMGW